MKKILSFLIIFIAFLMPINVYADGASVNIEVVGKVEKGSTIEILVNLKDVEKFYAASVDFTYDTSQLKVESITATEFITKHANDIMELGGETDKNGNTASYSFTFLGDSNGISGSGTLVKITASVLNNEKLSINQENMKIKLVHRVGDTVENYSYSFSGYGVDDTNNASSDSENSSNSSNNNSNSNNNNKDEESGNKSENSTSNVVNSNNNVSSNEDVNSNTSNDSSANIEGQDSNLNSNEEAVEEDTEKDESQTTNAENESDNEVLNDNTEAGNNESVSKERVMIWIISVVIILSGIAGVIKYRIR